MATANRWAMSDRRIFLAVGLVVVGLFVLCCGVGMSNPAVGGLGVAITVLAPGSIVLASMRSNVREYVYGEGEVRRAPPRPTGHATTGRCDMDLLVRAARVDDVLVRVRDPAAPVNKWPQIGVRLPVLLPNGNPRRTKVLWEQVRPHAEAAAGGESYFDGYAASAPSYGADLAVDEIPEDGAPLADQGVPYTEEPYRAESDVEAPVDVAVDVAVDAPVEPPVEAPVEPPVDATVEPPVEEPRRRRPSPRPRRPVDPVVEETAPSAERLPTDETTVVAHVPVPGADPTDPAAEPVVESVVEPHSHVIDEVSAGAPLPGITGPIEPIGPVVPVGGAFIGSALAPDPEPPEPPEPTDVTGRGDDEEPDDAFIAAYLADDSRRADTPGAGVHGVSVTLIVSDLGRSLDFYRDTVGLTEIDSGVGSAVLASGNARILLKRVADMPRVDRRVVHLNLEVDDVHAEYERLKAAGVEFVHRPRMVSQGEHLEQWAATFRDPDGHAITITRWEHRR